MFKSIKLEKGMYHNGLTRTLERLDPSENYKGTALGPLDAYERQLKRFDIKVGGITSDTVDKFFSSTESSVLFPEYIKRAVQQGFSEANKLSSLVASVTQINGLDYRGLTSEQVTDTPVVEECAALPETKVAMQKNLVPLKKRGRLLTASYEALRYQRLDLLTVVLKNIGSCIARSLLTDAAEALLNGDANSDAAEVIEATSKGNLLYADLLKLWASLAPYELNTMLASTETIQKILSLKEMKDSGASLTFHGSGKLANPMGASLVHAPSLPAGTIIGLDKTCSLEMIQSGDLNIDFDKIIDKQLESAGISYTAGFARIFGGAVKALQI